MVSGSKKGVLSPIASGSMARLSSAILDRKENRWLEGEPSGACPGPCGGNPGAPADICYRIGV